MLLFRRHHAVCQCLRIALDDCQRGFQVVRQIGQHALLFLRHRLFFCVCLLQLVEQMGEAVGHIAELHRQHLWVDLNAPARGIRKDRLMQRLDCAAELAAEQHRQQADCNQ